ncbi:hypothetical protein ACN083_02780 [Rothia sp. CCM 9418]
MTDKQKIALFATIGTVAFLIPAVLGHPWYFLLSAVMGGVAYTALKTNK